MGKIPGEADIGGISSPRSGRGIARVDTSGLTRGIEAFGRGVAQLGQGAQQAAASLLQRQQRLDTQEYQTRLEQFRFDEAVSFQEAQDAVAPGAAIDFTVAWEEGYLERANEQFGDTPDHLRGAVDQDLLSIRNVYMEAGFEFTRTEQTRASLEALGQTLDNTLQRVLSAATLETTEKQNAGLNEIIAAGVEHINAAPFLTDIERAEQIADWRRRAQQGFAFALIGTGEVGNWVGTDLLSTAARITQLETEGVASALRPDAELSEEAVAGYVDYLIARGLDATAGNIFLADILGPAGAVAVLSAYAITPLEDILSAEVMAANSGVLEGKVAGELIGWASARMAETASQLTPNLLDAVPFETAVALTLDDRNAQAKLERDQAAAQTNQVNQLQNDLFVSLYDGAGSEGIAQARREGWLTDIADIEKAWRIYEDANKRVLDETAAIAAINDPNFQWNPFTDQELANTGYLALGGMGNLLETLDPDDEEGLEAQAASMLLLREYVRKTQMVPDAALAALRGGMVSPDANTMMAAFTIMNGLELENPTVIRDALTAQQYGRYQNYRDNVKYWTLEDLAERLNPNLDSQALDRRNRLETDGLRVAAETTTLQIVQSFSPGWWGAGALQIPIDRGEVLELRVDYERLFSQQYAFSENAELAHTQAIEALQKVWGISDVGDVPRLMQYPPGRYLPPLYGGPGAPLIPAEQWVQEKLEAFVAREFDIPFTAQEQAEAAQLGPVPTLEWGLVATIETEGALNSGNPPYDLFVIDQDGKFHVRTVNLQADLELQEARDQFEVDREAELRRLGAIDAQAAAEARPELPLTFDDLTPEAFDAVQKRGLRFRQTLSEVIHDMAVLYSEPGFVVTEEQIREKLGLSAGVGVMRQQAAPPAAGPQPEPVVEPVVELEPGAAPWVETNFDDVSPNMMNELQSWAGANGRSGNRAIEDMAEFYGLSVFTVRNKLGLYEVFGEQGLDAITPEALPTIQAYAQRTGKSLNEVIGEMARFNGTTVEDIRQRLGVGPGRQQAPTPSPGQQIGGAAEPAAAAAPRRARPWDDVQFDDLTPLTMTHMRNAGLVGPWIGAEIAFIAERTGHSVNEVRAKLGLR